MNEQLSNPVQSEEWARLEAMVDAFAGEMKARLYQKKQEGFTGWDDPANLEVLAKKAEASVTSVSVTETHVRHAEFIPDFDRERRKCVDAANRLAMVWYIRRKEAKGE